MFSFINYIPSFNTTTPYPTDENIIDVPLIVSSGGHGLYDSLDSVSNEANLVSLLQWIVLAVLLHLSGAIVSCFFIYFGGSRTQEEVETQVEPEVKPKALAAELPGSPIEPQALQDLREIQMERKVEKYHSKWARTEACKRYDAAMKGLACKKDPILAQKRFEDEKAEFMHAIIETERCAERLENVETEIASLREAKT